MAGDGVIDGKFTIRSGGISQAIRDELGLTQDECNKLGKSVWTQIFEQVKAQDQQSNIYEGGSDAWGSPKENFKVYKDQTIEFSKEIWANIVKLVNDKLGKNIQVAQPEAPAAAEAEEETPAGTEVETEEEVEEENSEVTEPTVNTEQAKKDADAVKVTVPQPELKVQHNNYVHEANQIAKDLKTELQSNWVDQSKVKAQLEKLKNNPELTAMVVNAYGEGFAQDIDNVFGMGFGFNKSDFYNYVLAPLVAKAKSLGIDTKGINSKSDIAEMDKVARELAQEVYADYKAKAVKARDEQEKVQKTFDDANNFLAEVANTEPKPEIEIDQEEKRKTATLADGRRISVRYDDNGEICDIRISHDLTPSKMKDGSDVDCMDIRYTKEKALFDTDKNNGVYEGAIDKGYDFEKLKVLAEKIFGKWEAAEE